MSTLAFASVVDFAQCVDQKLSYETTIPKEVMPRLIESVDRIDGDIKAKFHFYRDLQGLNTIEGSIEACVILICQRCGREFKQNICANFSSTPDKAKAVSLRIENKLDLVELNEFGQFELLNFLEDSLMLEIPYAPKHEDDDPNCIESGELSFGKIDEKENPFASLAALKDKFAKD